MNYANRADFAYRLPPTTFRLQQFLFDLAGPRRR
jgi:hypothetical protein